MRDSNLHWRTRTLHAVRRHARLMEAQLHRLYAMLARLEADHEDDLADSLYEALDVPVAGADPGAGSIRGWDLDEPTEQPIDNLDEPPVVRPPPASPEEGDKPKHDTPATGGRPSVGRSASPVAVGGSSAERLAPQCTDHAPGAMPLQSLVVRKNINATRDRNTSSRSKRPVVFSFIVHVAALLLCLPLSYVTQSNENFFLLASPPTLLEDSTFELSSLNIETIVEEAEEETQSLEPSDLPRSESPLDHVAPIDGAEKSESPGDFNAIPNDLGTLLAGVGRPTGVRKRTAPGTSSAEFFGTRSQGERFVFIVDNSNSMKNGRLEAALEELMKSVEAMSRRQSFYVIFVSDQLYPMFYPAPAPALVPATNENKQRLADWLKRVQLAGGKNRELIKAIDLASSLNPEAVFLLWDGNLGNSQQVRSDVMTHLTRSTHRQFTIHTLGLGITSLDSEYNLATIAEANGGTYRRIDLPTPALRR